MRYRHFLVFEEFWRRITMEASDQSGHPGNTRGGEKDSVTAEGS